MVEVKNINKIDIKIAQALHLKHIPNIPYPFPIKVSKLAAWVNYNERVDGGACDDDFIDSDYARDFEQALCIDMLFRDALSIKPSKFYCNANGDGAVMEWEPNEDIYIHSKFEYRNLYNSFCDFLISSKFSERTGEKIKICFYPLYMDESIPYDKIVEKYSDVLFTKEIFNAKILYVHTHEGVYDVGHADW